MTPHAPHNRRIWRFCCVTTLATAPNSRTFALLLDSPSRAQEVAAAAELEALRESDPLNYPRPPPPEPEPEPQPEPMPEPVFNIPDTMYKEVCVCFGFCSWHNLRACLMTVRQGWRNTLVRCLCAFSAAARRGMCARTAGARVCLLWSCVPFRSEFSESSRATTQARVLLTTAPSFAWVKALVH